MRQFLFITCIICGLIVSDFLFVRCKGEPEINPKDTTNATTPAGETVPTGKLLMHLHNFIESTEVDAYNISYTNGDERKISLSIGQLYISNIELIKEDGSLYRVPNTIIKKDQEIDTYLIGDVPVGKYKSLKFDIGLDQATSQKVPTASTDDVLNSPEMWFGNSAQPEGYVFVNIQGKVDTTTAADGTTAQMQPFKYRIGSPANLQKKTMPDRPFVVSTSRAEYVHMLIDHSKLFNGIALHRPENLTVWTVADNASQHAIKIRNNILNMILYED